MCDAWDAEECDAVDNYAGICIRGSVERYKSRSG